MTKPNYIKIAKNAAIRQITELKKINNSFGKSFLQTVETISNCRGKVITAGIGKSGIIARKISATMSSIGISSFYLNPVEANHCDLGQIEKKDILLIFSYSGNTQEIVNLLKYSNRNNIKIVGVSSKKDSLLLKASDIKILLPSVNEVDPTKLVPTSSTSITLLWGDCLAVTLMHKLKFSKEKFKAFHPGGSIGNKLLLAKDIMVTGNKLPLINIKKNISDALRIMNQKKLGVIVVIDKGYISGLITDGNLRREMKYYSKETSLEKFMTKNPYIVGDETPASKALSIMNEKKITSLLVAKQKNIKKKKKLKLIGIIHIHFLLKYGIK